MRNHVKHSIIYSVKMTFRIWTCKRIAFRLAAHAYLFLSRYGRCPKIRSFRTQYRKSFLCNRSGNCLCCQVKKLVTQIFTYRLDSRKHGRHSLSDSCRRLNEKLFLHADSLIYTDCYISLPCAVRKRKFHSMK